MSDLLSLHDTLELEAFNSNDGLQPLARRRSSHREVRTGTGEVVGRKRK